MDILRAIKTRRTIRQFEKKEIPRKILETLIDAARLAPSARNRQPLEYIVINEPKLREKLFQTLSWGGKLPDGKPDEKHHPAAYVVILANTKINPSCDFDVGLATENLLLSAASFNLAGCILGAIDRDKLRSLFNVPTYFEIKLVIALGYPAEKSVVEETDEITNYFRNSKGILHIPKRRLEKIIHFNKF